MKAMILAAGLGTRLKPFTDKFPKALATVNGKTLLQRNIEYLQSFGIHQIIINIHHFGDQIREVLEKNNNFGSIVSISDESDQLLETGGGLKKASWFFDNEESFLLMNVDILTDLSIDKMVEYHYASKAIATLAVCDRTTSRYFLFDDEKRLCGWRNVTSGKQVISRQADKYYEKAFSGIHLISSQIFKYLHGGDLNTPEKFSIVDPYLEISKTQVIQGFDHTGAKLVDVGKPESVAIAEKLFV